MIKLQLLVHIISLLLWLIVPLAAATPPSMALPNCTAKCGDVDIPYPFGIGKGCYYNTSFEITCNDSFTPMKPFLSIFNLEVLEVDLNFRLVTLNIPIGMVVASKCPTGEGTSTTVWTSTTFMGSRFRISRNYNDFTVVGCDNALLTFAGKIMAGCTAVCSTTYSITTSTTTTTTTTTGGGCHGIACCKTSIPSDPDFYNITITGNTRSDCTYAFLAKKGWYANASDLSKPYAINHDTKLVPVVMFWGPANLYSFRVGEMTPSYDNCFTPTKEGSLQCECGWAYRGNPYIPNGCTVVESCANCEKECQLNSTRSGGSYYCGPKRQDLLGLSLGGGFLLVLLCCFCFWLYKLIKKKRMLKLKNKFFKRNGGLLLQQQISSCERTVDNSIIFTSKELEKATDNFNENRILGQGGQGTVYKGMLTDGKIIAIKKSMVVDESQIEQFINEVVILSQINHRSIVKLLGCCLETEVPSLVYEFVSNGNLFQLIHDQNEDFQLSWKMRLQIATEVAGALAYLHSASSIPIYHRDIKSTNILLDEKYRAKVADFGTSRSIAIDKTHLTTLVHGTFGYLDPEYFRTSQFTEKSDVYSFGVVLVELLTGKEPISVNKSEEEKSLVTRFILCLKEARLFDLLDARVIEEAQKEDVIVVADIARRCLSLNGKKRPTMKEVLIELDGIRTSHMHETFPQNFHDHCGIFEIQGPGDDVSTSTQSSLVYDRAFSSDMIYARDFSLDVDPLLLNTI